MLDGLLQLVLSSCRSTVSWYETPISEAFLAVRDLAPLQVTLEPDTFIGLIGSALLVISLSSFVYYWLHRVQHESLFWWRIHATHHPHHQDGLHARETERTLSSGWRFCWERRLPWRSWVRVIM